MELRGLHLSVDLSVAGYAHLGLTKRGIELSSHAAKRLINLELIASIK